MQSTFPFPPIEFSEELPDFKGDEATVYEVVTGAASPTPYEITRRSDCSADQEGEFKNSEVRALTCACFKRRVWSRTIRRITNKESGTVSNPAAKVPFVSGYLKERTSGHMNLPTEVCRLLRSVIFKSPSAHEEEYMPLERAEGLIVIAGSTKSGKSTYVRGLIHQYLNGRLLFDKHRRPHLVTFEDPIEDKFSEAPIQSGFFSGAVDYTPRQVGWDVASLEDAITDALRQTPDIFYVGEIRKPKQWPEIVRFAGTGHLAITTTHAGSLQEAMWKLFLDTRSKTPEGRSAVASRLVAVVHLRPHQIELDGQKNQVVIPTVWRRTDAGVMNMMEYGLSSVIPTRVDEEWPNKSISCIGRAWFARRLAEVYGGRQGIDWPDKPELVQLQHQAAGWDLLGA